MILTGILAKPLENVHFLESQVRYIGISKVMSQIMAQKTVQQISANESYSNINTPCTVSLNAQQMIAFQQMARRQQNQYTMCDHSTKLK